MKTKSKGDASVAAVMSALLRCDYPVLLPFGDGQRYDLVFQRGDTFLSVQVKTGRRRGGSLAWNACSLHYHTGGSRRDYRGDVDYFGVHDATTGKSYLVPVDHVGKSLGTLRVDPLRKGGHSNGLDADDYEIR